LADMHRRYRYAMAAFLAFEAQDIAHVFSKRTQNQQKSLFHQEEALQVRFKASSYLSRTRRVGVSTCPSGRLLWRHRAQPSATLDKRHPDFCRLILPTISPNRQGRSMIRLSLSLGLRRLGRFGKFSLLILFPALLPRLLALAFGLRGLGNRLCFLGVFCRHIAP